MALAAARLGSPPALAAEFAKVAEPVSWLPVRVLGIGFGAVVLAALFLGYSFARGQDGRLRLLLAAHVCTVLLGYSASFFVGALAVCYVFTKPFRDLSAGQMQSVRRAAFTLTGMALGLTLVGVLLGAVWAKDHLGRYWSWAPQEIGGACVLAWDAVMLSLLWLHPASERLAIRLGLLGNMVVGFAWFAGSWTQKSYGVPPVFRLLLLFAVVQLVLFAAGFLPVGRLRHRGT